MNTQLVESIVQLINSLTPEEQALLEEKLHAKDNDWQTEYQKILELKTKVFARRGRKSFDPPLEEYIQTARDERTAEQDDLIRLYNAVRSSLSWVKLVL